METKSPARFILSAFSNIPGCLGGLCPTPAMDDTDGCPPQGAAHAVSGKSVAPASIALHPSGRFVVVSIGAALRIFDLRENVAVSCHDDSLPSLHWDAIRAVAFSRDGKLFASAGDDKLVKLWDAASWHCLKTCRLSKKVNAIGFSHDASWLIFADKFGVVYVTSTVPSRDKGSSVHAQLLAHCCSIITGLETSEDGKFVVTSDRDFKIRVTAFPDNPSAGAHEIHSYCLGHTNFVSCVAFVGERSADAEYLISGGGDGTVRLWQYKAGRLLDEFHVYPVAGTGNDADKTDPEDVDRAVLGIAVCSGGSIVAVAVQRLGGVILLHCDEALAKLCYFQTILLPEGICPTSLAFDVEKRLWVVAGAAATVETGDEVLTSEAAAAAEARGKAIAAAATARIYVVGTALGGARPAYIVLQDEFVPGGNLLLDTLQGRKTEVTEAARAAQAAELAMRNLLTKRHYTVQQRENRKRFRNDKKLPAAER